MGSSLQDGMKVMQIGDRVWVKDLAEPDKHYPYPGTIIERTWKSEQLWKVHHDDDLECWYRSKDLTPLVRIASSH